MMKHSCLVVLLFLCIVFPSTRHATAQEATVEPEPAPILGATYSTTDGHFSVGFPKNWVLQSADSDVNKILIHMSGDFDALKYFPDRSDKFLSGNIIVSVAVFERSVLQYPNVTFDNTLDVLSLRKALPDVEPNWEYETLTALTINNQPAVQTDVKLADYADGYDLLIDLGDGLLARVTAYTRPGEVQGFNPLIQAIAASITHK